MESVKRCQQITESHEKSKIVRLSLGERMSIRIHLSICRRCRKYFSDSAQLDEWLKKRFKHQSTVVTFSSEEKDQLKSKLGV